nr:TIGR03915 family putative DNA repair protein [Acetatifactor sp.]
MYLYRCEDTLEGIFTAIYRVYEDKRSADEVLISVSEEYLLFYTEVVVTTDYNRSMKVARTLRKKFGEEDYLFICYALASSEEDKAQAVFRTIAKGIRDSVGVHHLFDAMADQYVNRAYKLGNAASRECSHLRGFLRFQECEGKVLFAKIGPHHDLVPFLMPHFADRFSMESFIIYDEVREKMGMHIPGKGWYMASAVPENIEEAAS